MLSKKITFSLLSLTLLTNFALASNTQSEQVPNQVMPVEPTQVTLAQNMPQQTRWETFVYKVAPMGKYIAPISGYAGVATAAVALGLSLRDKATLKQAAVNTVAAGVVGSFAAFNCLFWPYFHITESLD